MRIDTDGWHIRQSDLKNTCLEKLRRETTMPDKRVENDAATVGTLLHALIEHELMHAPFTTARESAEWLADEFVKTVAAFAADGIPYVRSSFGTDDKALDLLAKLAQSWSIADERGYLLTHDNVKSEWNFDLPFTEVMVKKHGKKAEEIPVFLTGTSDIVLPHAVWDWKTSGREYAQWEKQRWDIQASVYTWAAAQALGLNPDEDGLYNFYFKVFIRGKVDQPQTVPVVRSRDSWLWLENQVSHLVNFVYNMGLDTEWPMNDQDVLCSDKWCPHWSDCKGTFVTVGRWV